MFGLGLSEVLLIAIVAIVVIGPKKLPEVARALGKGYAEFKKALDGFKDAVKIDDVINDKKGESKNLNDVYNEKWKDSNNVSDEEKTEDIKDKTNTEGKVQ
ncbi:MAG: twin-arginine translocase TatA/TatE family subunit [Calditerrivibrio sp.]|nr:twin-arginine translocase TatA/TatE family subunit [Calditerrivibrio sp.]MCA1932216.1 twin-arginine translocase TatA/TatE family subunit [Calditerrivibrio sp.]